MSESALLQCWSNVHATDRPSVLTALVATLTPSERVLLELEIQCTKRKMDILAELPTELAQRVCQLVAPPFWSVVVLTPPFLLQVTVAYSHQTFVIKLLCRNEAVIVLFVYFCTLSTFRGCPSGSGSDLRLGGWGISGALPCYTMWAGPWYGRRSNDGEGLLSIEGKQSSIPF
jgi:hypothetical protein